MSDDDMSALKQWIRGFSTGLMGLCAGIILAGGVMVAVSLGDPRPAAIGEIFVVLVGAAILLLTLAAALRVATRPSALPPPAPASTADALDPAAARRLEESERRYRELIEATRVIAWEFDPATKQFTFVSPHAEQILGFSREDWRTRGFWHRQLHPDDREETVRIVREHLARGEDHDLVYRMVAADGRAVWMHDITSVVRDNGHVTQLRGVLVDVTRQQAAERALRQIVEGTTEVGQPFFAAMVRSIVNAMNVRVAFVGEVIAPDRLELLAVHGESGLRAECVYQLAGSPAVEVLEGEAVRSFAAAREKFPDCALLSSCEGDDFIAAPLRSTTGNVLGILALVSDGPRSGAASSDLILRVFAARAASEFDRLRTERSLRRSGTQLARAQALARIGSWSWNLITGSVELSDELCRITGIEQRAFNATTEVALDGMIHPDDRGRLRNALRAALETGHAEAGEFRIIGRDGEERRVWTEAELIRADDGSLRMMIGTVQDITERKRFEHRLSQNEAQLELLINQTPAILWTVDRDLRVTSIAGAGRRLAGFDHRDVTGMTLFDILQTTDRSFPPLRKHLAALRGQSGEYDTDFNERSFHARVQPLRGADGEIIGCIGVAHDMTARREHERQLEDRSKREQLLFRELDHRVRNNLSSLMALVDMSEREANDKSALATAIRSRISAMAAAHALLSRSSSRAVEFRSILDTLIPQQLRSRVECSGEPFSVPAGKTMALAMILNELVMNALKHGALAQTGGEVTCAWEIVDDLDSETRAVHLRWIERGAAAAKPESGPGTGQTLIHGLVQTDLRGIASFAYEPAGLRCEIAFPLATLPAPAAPAMA